MSEIPNRNPPQVKFTGPSVETLLEEIEETCEKARRHLDKNEMEDFLMFAGMVLEDYLE